MPSSYAIGPHFEAFIQKLLESGRYANASEIVRTGLRLLEEEQERRDQARAEVWAKIDEGIADIEAGRTIPAEEVFAELRAMISERSKRREAAE